MVVVNKDDYETCNTQNPIMKLEDGHSIFKFEKSGLFFFISGTKFNCINGQKLIIVVLAVRNPRYPSPPPPPPVVSKAPAPAPASSPPSEPPLPPAVDGPSDTPPAVDTTSHHPPPHRSFATAASISSVLVSTVLIGYIVLVIF